MRFSTVMLSGASTDAAPMMNRMVTHTQIGRARRCIQCWRTGSGVERDCVSPPLCGVADGLSKFHRVSTMYRKSTAYLGSQRTRRFQRRPDVECLIGDFEDKSRRELVATRLTNIEGWLNVFVHAQVSRPEPRMRASILCLKHVVIVKPGSWAGKSTQQV